MTSRESDADTPTVSPEETIDKLSVDLDEAAAILLGWHKSKDSDSVRRQAQRKFDYARACELLKPIPYRAEHHGHVMQLTVGEKPVETINFTKNAYQFIEHHRGRTLEPGATIILKREATHYHPGVSYETRYSSVYLGEFGSMLEVVTIAGVLGEGGTLQLVPLSEEE